MAEVVLRNIKKSFGPVDIIKGVDIDINDKEFVVFVGPSGCGKSTLLRMIAGLESISDGELSIDGKRVNDLSPADRGIAMVFQTYALYPHMTVRDNMGFSLKLAKVPKAEIDRKVNEAARILKLDPLMDRKPKALSGGQRQRVAIGRAIVRNPKVFLFDEPLSNLDAALRVQMRIEIARMHSDFNATMIYVTHDQVEAMTLADRIVVLNAGRVEQVGRPLALYHHPATIFVAGFIGSPKMNFIAAKIQQPGDRMSTVVLRSGVALTAQVDTLAARAEAAVTLGIRAEHIVLVDDPAADDGNTLTAEVIAQERLGDLTYLYVQIPDADHALTVRAQPDINLTAGSRVRLRVPAESVYMFDADGKAFARCVEGVTAGNPASVG